jgi:hypothetical protein
VTGEYLSYLIRMLADRFDNACGGGVDNGGHAAGLGVEGILDGHADSID